MLRIIAILFLLTSESIVFAQPDFETLLTEARVKRSEQKLDESRSTFDSFLQADRSPTSREATTIDG